MRPALLLLVLICAGPAMAHPAHIVAAERVYADIAAQVAGPDAQVTGLLSNPDQDPHLFEPSPSMARALAAASIVVLNGAGYDPWMQALLRGGPAAGRTVIDVAHLLQVPPGANPHLWYDPTAAPALARAVAAALSAAAPGRLEGFLTSLRPLEARIAALRARFAGVSITATEPVFGPMAQAIGLKMLNEAFQHAVMNGSEPSPGETAAFERSLRTRTARVLIYNPQTTDETTRRLRRIAAESGVPIVAVRETEPPDTTYQHWMMQTLDALAAALGEGA